MRQHPTAMHYGAQENRNREVKGSVSYHILLIFSSSGILKKTGNWVREFELTYLLSRVLDLWKWDDVIWRDMSAAVAIWSSHPEGRETLEIL